MDDARRALDELIQQRGVNYSSVSRLLGRNAAYIQQYIRRGSPRQLDEQDRSVLARFFGVDEKILGAPAVVQVRSSNWSMCLCSMSRHQPATALSPKWKPNPRSSASTRSGFAD